MHKLLIVKPSFKPYNAFPVGFAYVLACLKKNNIEFDFIDLETSINWFKDVKKQLLENEYYAVATGGLIGSYVFFQQFSQLIHHYRPNVPVILGGNIVKDSSDDLLFKTIGINFGIIGEAETSFPQLLNSIRNKENLFGIPGLVYRNDLNQIIRNKQERVRLEEMNNLPAWHHFDMDYYISKSSLSSLGNSLRTLPVLTGRGCIGACAFCSPSIGGFRKRPIPDVIAEIKEMCQRFDFDVILFYNEMFYPKIEMIKEFCDSFSAEKLKKAWAVSVRVDSNIDVETFKLMKKAGCVQVAAGIESGSDKILKSMRKNITSGQIKTFFRNAREARMASCGTFIIGFEDETAEDIRKSVELVIDGDINTDGSLMYVYPGTEVFRHACQKKLITNELQHLEKITRLVTTLYSPYVKKEFFNMTQMPNDELIDVAVEEMRKYKTHIFNHHKLKNIKCETNIEGINVNLKIKGNCAACGHTLEINNRIVAGVDYLGICGEGVGMGMICPKCLATVAVDVFESQEGFNLKEHLKGIKKILAESEKIVLMGINHDALFLLKVNFLDIDYSKIVGIYDVRRDFTGGIFITFPVLCKKELENVSADVILVLDNSLDISTLTKLLGPKIVKNKEICFIGNEKMGKKIRLSMAKIKSQSWTQLFFCRLTSKAKKIYHKFRPAINKLTVRSLLFAECFQFFKSKYYLMRK